MVPIPDKRLDKIAAIVKPQKVLPTTVKFVDIAGLVEGASKGEGLGNKFLANIRETEAIAHVVRCFENPDVIHVAGKIDPLSDIEIIETELALADLETVEKALIRVSRSAKSGDKDAVAEKNVYERAQAQLAEGDSLRSLALDEHEQQLLKAINLLTIKPTLFLANVDEAGIKGNAYVKQVEEYAEKLDAVVVPFCAAIEAEIAELDDDDKTEFLQELELEEAGLDRVIHAGYDLLDLQTYFTAGVKEVRAWTVHQGASAPQAAGVIHTDFEKGFIRAEVIAYDDFIQYQGEHGAKEAGKWRLEGKDYIVHDGDVMHFRFNT